MWPQKAQVAADLLWKNFILRGACNAHAYATEYNTCPSEVKSWNYWDTDYDDWKLAGGGLEVSCISSDFSEGNCFVEYGINYLDDLPALINNKNGHEITQSNLDTIEDFAGCCSHCKSMGANYFTWHTGFIGILARSLVGAERVVQMQGGQRRLALCMAEYVMTASI